MEKYLMQMVMGCVGAVGFAVLFNVRAEKLMPIAVASALSWLGYGNSFGLSSPLVLDLGVLTLQFGLTIRFTIAGIIGIVLAFLIYRKM